MLSDFSSRSSDPLVGWRRRTAVLVFGSLALVTPALAWALLPLSGESDSPPISSSLSPATPTVEEVVTFDCSAFQAVLWTIPSTTRSALPAPQEEPQKRLPLELDLVGVSAADGALIAALYDRQADRLLLVRDGEEALGARVTRLSQDQVDLTRDDAKLVIARRREAR